MSDLEIIDGAVPLVRNDEPWEWFVVFLDGATTPTVLSGGPVTDPDNDQVRSTDGFSVLTGAGTCSAEIRWQNGRQPVTVEIIDEAEGLVRLSLTAAETTDMPLGRLSKLYIALGTDTEAIVPVNVIEGLYP